MEKEFEKLLEFWKNNEGTGKLFNFKFLLKIVKFMTQSKSNQP